MAGQQKIYYIDNLRVILIALVIMHHTFITYGAPGGWYFYDKTSHETALIFMTLFVAVNQSFFMGLFFFLSSFFIESSYIKKGAAKFITDRLKRLGIPLLFYSFLFSPALNFIIYRHGYHKTATFVQFLRGYNNWIDPGVMWFVAALLVFTFIYVLYMLLHKPANKQYTLPSNANIFSFAVALGLVSFAVRIFFPVGWVLHPLGFQFAHFTQYIALFIAGIMAWRYKWLQQTGFKKSKQWLRVAVVMIVLFPFLFLLKEITNSPLDAFQGGGTWQSLIVALWEQVTGISIIVALLGIAKQKWNYTTPVLRQMARAAYATYILHPLAVVSISLVLKNADIEPVIKLLIAIPFALLASFFIGTLATKLPVVKNIV